MNKDAGLSPSSPQACHAATETILEQPQVPVADLLASNLVAICFRLFLLQHLIPADGHFEPELSLALDRALADLEAAVW
jgi:hypothetical protein